MPSLQRAFKHIDQFAERWMKELNIPGLAIVVTNREKLLSEEPAERQQLLQSYFRERLAKILRMPPSRLNVNQPLTEMGVDSLMAMEFRTAIQVNLGVAVPLVSLLQGPSLAKLAEIVIAQLTGSVAVIAEGLSGPGESGSPVPKLDSSDQDREDAGDTLGHFSDEDVDVLLQSMLDED